jgi:hypothetical protein
MLEFNGSWGGPGSSELLKLNDDIEENDAHESECFIFERSASFTVSNLLKIFDPSDRSDPFIIFLVDIDRFNLPLHSPNWDSRIFSIKHIGISATTFLI